MSVSVIIPTYNRASLVTEAIDSVLAQSYKDTEIIVIDDGSCDDTKQKLRKYKNRIKYIYQDNQGLNVARNNALDYSSGEYIAFLDSDDLWLDYKLDLQVDLLSQYPHAGFVFSDFFIFSEDGRRTPHGLNTWPDIPHNWDEIYNESVIHHNKYSINIEPGNSNTFKVFFGDIYNVSIFGPIVLPSTTLIKSSVLTDKTRFIEHSSLCGTDWEFFARLSHMSGAAFIDMETTLNRSHEDTVRLTRIDPRKRINMRLDLINHTWESNDEFYCSNLDDVNIVKRRYYIKLLKYSLSNNEIKQAREYIKILFSLNTGRVDLSLFLLVILAYLPARSILIKLIKTLIR